MEKEEKNTSNKFNFMTLAVHKLKTPLSSIKLCLEMLLNGDFGELNEEQKEAISKVYHRNDNLIYLVNDLLNIEKGGGDHYDMAMVDAEQIMKSVIESEQEEIEKKRIKINFAKSQILHEVKVDKDKIFLALQNIVDNAVKYTPVGGEVSIYLKMDGENLECVVKDSGIGVPEKEKGKLFTEFFRGKNAEKIEPMGSGLGLFIAKKTIEDHHGKIWFESEEGKGSTFYIALPAK